MKIHTSYVIFILLLLVTVTSHAGEQVSTKRLPSCNDTPNCVSSQATDKLHYIMPYQLSGDPKRAWAAFRKLVFNHERMVITHESEDSLHAEATSLVLQFVDDIDALLDTKAGVIHIRSASRVGHSDFGVNRKRMEGFRTELRKLHVVSLR